MLLLAVVALSPGTNQSFVQLGSRDADVAKHAARITDIPYSDGNDIVTAPVDLIEVLEYVFAVGVPGRCHVSTIARQLARLAGEKAVHIHLVRIVDLSEVKQ